MTLLIALWPRVGAFAFAGAICLPLMAAELEGTPVPIDGSAPVEMPMNLPVPAPMEQAQPDAPAPGQVPEPPPGDEHQSWWKAEQERQMRAMERQARNHEQQMRDHQNWQREWDKGFQEAFGGHDFDAGDFNVALLIPIFAVIFIFGGPIFLLGFLMLQHYRDKARRQQDINANIDKLLAAGRDIPVELLRGDEPRGASDTGDLSKGIRNLFLGIGLLIFLTALVGFDIGAVGFILIALGCSQTLVWYLNKPKAGSVTEQQAGQQD